MRIRIECCVLCLFSTFDLRPFQHACSVRSCEEERLYYRGLQWLPQTIEAILTQNSVECHVHLINDQSPEDDTEVRQEFRGFPNLTWYKNRVNIGCAPSKSSTGLKIMTSEVSIIHPSRAWRLTRTVPTDNLEPNRARDTLRAPVFRKFRGRSSIG